MVVKDENAEGYYNASFLWQQDDADDINNSLNPYAKTDD
jgi:hypothetical protein